MSIATENQKQVFQRVARQVENGGKVSISKIMRESGYSPQTAKNPSKVTDSKGWKQLLAQYSEEPIMDNIYGIALSNDDKRSALMASNMILKLKDRFPAGKLKINQYEEELKELS